MNALDIITSMAWIYLIGSVGTFVAFSVLIFAAVLMKHQFVSSPGMLFKLVIIASVAWPVTLFMLVNRIFSAGSDE